MLDQIRTVETAREGHAPPQGPSEATADEPDEAFTTGTVPFTRPTRTERQAFEQGQLLILSQSCLPALRRNTSLMGREQTSIHTFESRCLPLTGLDYRLSDTRSRIAVSVSLLWPSQRCFQQAPRTGLCRVPGRS